MRAPIFPRLLVALLGVCLVAPGAAYAGVQLGSQVPSTAPLAYEPSGWTSSLYPRSWQPGYANGNGYAISDFSYAGYRYGMEPIPSMAGSLTVDVTKRPFLADNTGVREATKQIQSAIDHVAASGGGVVYLPAGTYAVAPDKGQSAALRISSDNVVLRGAGREQTFIRNTRTDMAGLSVILVRPERTRDWYSAVPAGANLAADSRDGAMEVRVTDPQSFSVGDMIVIRTEASDAWLAERGNPRLWSALTMDATTFLRRIVSKSEDGALRLDVPVRSDVLMRDRGSKRNVYAAPEHLSGCGVEDLSIGMVAHPGGSTLEADVNMTSAVRLQNALDSWVQRVGTYAPPGNPAAIHLLSEGIWLEDCRNVTVRDCIMRYPQYRGASNGYGFLVRGSENLLEGCAAVSTRHSYSLAYWHTTGNVIRESAGQAPIYASDFHMWFAAANLFERMRMHGDWIDATYRHSGGTTIHGHTTSRSVFWNIAGLAAPASTPYGWPNAVVHTIQWWWGAAVGTRGPLARVSNNPGTDGVLADPTPDLVEGVGEAETLVPASLSRDQLRRRAGGGSSTGYQVFGVVQPAKASQLGSRIVTISPVPVRAGTPWRLTFDVPRGRRATSARLVLYGRSRRSGASIEVRDGLTGRVLGTATKSGSAPSGVFVVDVSEAVCPSQDIDTSSSIVLEVSDIGGGANFDSPSSDRTGFRPRLEIETPADPVVPIAALSGGAQGFVDGTARTGRSALRSGSSVTLDLGDHRTLTGVGVAWPAGGLSFAEIRASSDGITWIPVRGLLGGGEGGRVESYPFDSPVSARYLRVVSFGSGSYSAHAEIAEIEAYGH